MNVRHTRRRGGVLAVLGALLLAACSSTDGFDDQAYSRDRAQLMFESAYGHVQANFIDPVGMDTIALSGLSRLSVVDGRMQVKSTDTELVLLKEGLEVQRFVRPDPNDPDAWAAITAEILERSRAASPVSASAPAEEIYSSMLEGVVSTLDQYSRYEDAKSARNQRASRDGFGGIGVTIRSKEDETIVVETLPDSPAAAAGIQAGDVLTHADGKALAGMQTIDVASLLRGRIGTTVEITVRKAADGGTGTVSVERVHLVPPTVIGKLENGIGVVRIRSFNRRTSADLEETVERLADEHDEALAGLVLDVRDNPGGLLDQAIQVADLFLTGGPVIATKGRHSAASSAFGADAFQIAPGVPIAILMNARSASASEMLAAALQDRGRAVVVGSTSHGKGSVQKVEIMPNGGELVVTWSRMLAPSGYIIDGLGILPNICTSKGGTDTDRSAALPSPNRLARQFQDWRRYDRVDLGLATTLRRTCPPSFEAPDSDLEIAATVLREPSAYAMALTPSRRAAGTARDAQGLRHRS